MVSWRMLLNPPINPFDEKEVTTWNVSQVFL